MSEVDPESSLPPPRPTSRAKSRSSLATRTMMWIRLWARDTFSRDQMVSSLKSLAWVAPLTFIIWVYAEREQTSKQEGQTIPITVKSADPKLIVTVDQDEQAIVGTVYGPHAAVDKVTEELKLIPNNKQGVVIELPASYGIGPNTIPTALVSENDMFKRAGVTITDTRPLSLHVIIDKMDDFDLEVKSPPDVTNLVNAPAFEPRVIRITGPHNVLQAAIDSKKLNVYADFKSYNELNIPGKHDLSGVPLILSGVDKTDAISIAPIAVKASVEVRQLDARVDGLSMPIYVTQPPGLDDYKIEIRGGTTVSEVAVVGPSDHIEAIRRKDPGISLKARIEVSLNDKNSLGDPHTAKLIFDLPFPDVRVSDKDADRTVEYKMVAKDAAP